MTVLVADIGGTNSRLALADEYGALHAARRFSNDAFQGFGEVLIQYQAQCDTTGVSGCCIAIAGPVSGTMARLTNREWNFSTSDFAGQLPGVAPASVLLVNDLAALGHALPTLKSDQIDVVRDAGARWLSNDQALVAGLGTGFNICLVKGEDAVPAVIESELGHASLPANVARLLQEEIGAAALEFDCCEALFSGRGLSRLFGILSRGEELDGGHILSAYVQGDAGQATATVEIMANLLGVFARELVFQYMPLRGLYFAGSAARGILRSPARSLFLKAFDATGRFSDHLGGVPVGVITDDSAALHGAARLYEAMRYTRS